MKENSYTPIEKGYMGKFGYSTKLPDKVRAMFMWICQDIVILDRKWRYYRELFIDDVTKKYLMETARSVYSVFEESLFFDILLSIARLNDDQRIGKYENISLIGLVTRARMKTALRIDMNRFKRNCRAMETIRNKRLAHRDFNTFIEPNISIVPRVTIQEIDSAIELAERIVVSVLQKFDNCDMTFKLTSPGGPDQLLRFINQFGNKI